MQLEDCVRIICTAIKCAMQRQDTLLIAVDGRCASGKTTLAETLQKTLPCTLFHMDDFFLRPEQRTQERLLLPGGNVDYERFESEVLKPLECGESIIYRPFDCHLQRLLSPVYVTPRRIILVEGAYSCHPQLWNYYDLHIFMTVDPEEQIRRIRIRNGAETETFKKKWIPLEEKYFHAFQIESYCDIILKCD